MKHLLVGIATSFFFLSTSPSFAQHVESVPQCNGALYCERVAEWHDPLTPPKGPKLTCVKWFKAIGTKTCIGHKYEWQRMRNKLYIRVDGPTADKAKAVANKCFQEAIAAGLISGISAAAVTAGAGLPAAKTAFVNYFISCVKTNGLEAMGVSFPTDASWDDWS